MEYESCPCPVCGKSGWDWYHYDAKEFQGKKYCPDCLLLLREIGRKQNTLKKIFSTDQYAFFSDSDYEQALEQAKSRIRNDKPI